MLNANFAKLKETKPIVDKEIVCQKGGQNFM